MNKCNIFKVEKWSVKDADLMNEMKKNCLEGSKYKDEKAEEKFKMLCHLEDYAIGYYLLIEAINKAIKYIEENSPNISNSELYELLEILKGGNND